MSLDGLNSPFHRQVKVTSLAFDADDRGSLRLWKQPKMGGARAAWDGDSPGPRTVEWKPQAVAMHDLS